MLERALGDDAEYVPGHHGVPLPTRGSNVQACSRSSAGSSTSAREQRAPERVVPVSGEHVERALGPVEDATQQAGAELDLQRTAGVDDGLADPQAGGVLVDLDRDPLALEPDDLARQRRLADAHDVVQPHALEATGNHDRAGHTPDLAARPGGHCSPPS